MYSCNFKSLEIRTIDRKSDSVLNQDSSHGVFHAEKCCHLASEHEASAKVHLPATVQQHSPVPDL